MPPAVTRTINEVLHEFLDEQKSHVPVKTVNAYSS